MQKLHRLAVELHSLQRPAALHQVFGEHTHARAYLHYRQTAPLARLLRQLGFGYALGYAPRYPFIVEEMLPQRLLRSYIHILSNLYIV